MEYYNIKIGFIIFNDKWKQQLPSINGHRSTAFNWIRENNLLDVYRKILGKKGIYDEVDFLMECVGAVKLVSILGNYYCVLPKMEHSEKDYIKNYYKNLGYIIVNDIKYDEEEPKIKTFSYKYNRTFLNSDKGYIYNPVKIGD